MKKLNLFTLLLLSVSFLRAQTMIDKTNWNLLFEENFDTKTSISQLNSDWTYFPPRWGTKNIFQNCLFTTDNLKINNGKLEIKLEPTPTTIVSGDTFNFKSGMIVSSYNGDCGSNTNGEGYLYGMFEIRCKLPKNIRDSYINPSFWLRGSNEMDIFEVNTWSTNTGNQLFASDHWGSGSCSTFYNKQTPGGLDDEYHTYTGVWTPNEISWFFDGKEIRTTKNPIWNSADCNWGRMNMIIYISRYSNHPNDPLLHSNDPMYIDYIKTYKPKSTNTNWNFRKNSSNSYDVLFQQLTPYQTNVKKSKICMSDNGVNIFYVGRNDNKLYNYFWNGSSWAWALCNSSANDVGEDLTYFQNKVYYRSTNNSLKYFQWNGSAWINYSTPISNCAGFINIDNQGKVFFKGTDNNLYYWASGWSAASKITNDGSVNGGIQIASCGCIAFWRDFQNNLRQAYWGSSWNLLGAVVSNGKVTNSIAYDDNYNVYFSGSDGFIYKYKANYGSIGAAASALSTDIGDNNSVGELTISPDKKMIFYRGNDSRLWYYFNDGDLVNNPGKWYSSPAKWFNNNIDGPFVFNTNGTLYVKSTANYIAEIRPYNGEITTLACDSPWYQAYKRDSTFSTGVSYFDDKSDMRIYPNPFSNNISISGLSKDITNVLVYGIDGKVIKSENVDAAKIGTNMNIELPEISAGIYFLKLIGNTPKTYKIIKQ